MLAWEVEGQDIIDGAAVGMFDAGDPAEERRGFCWQTNASCMPHVGRVSASAAATGAGVAVRGPPKKANKRRAKKDQQGATSSPIKRSRPGRIWVCQEPECVYTSGRKGAEHSPHRETPLSSRDLLEVARVSGPVCPSHTYTRLQAILSDT